MKKHHQVWLPQLRKGPNLDEFADEDQDGEYEEDEDYGFFHNL